MQPNPITASAALMLAGSLLLAATLAPAAEVPQQTLRQLRESGQILPLEKISAAARAIKPGEILFVSPWLIQRHTELWDRPDVFDPDRFADPESKESQRRAYIPFSAGPRVCLGASFAMQEGMLILACLARDFRFEAVEGHTPKPIARNIRGNPPSGNYRRPWRNFATSNYEHEREFHHRGERGAG